MKLSQELIAILAVGVTLTGLQMTLFFSLRGEMASMETRLRGEMSDDARRACAAKWATCATRCAVR